MKYRVYFLIFITSTFFSCSSFNVFKETILIKDVVAEKERIDKSKNPAEILLLKNNLSEKILYIEKIKVKDIIISTNVDYDFCVLADISTDKGPIECYIYTSNIRRISKLKKGESVISVEGEFNRYFSVLDNYYTKVEITNSKITIIKE